MDLAAAEATRAVQRGADSGAAAALLATSMPGAVSTRALERYRKPRARSRQTRRPRWVRCRACSRSTRAAEALPLVEQLLAQSPRPGGDARGRAKARAATGDAAGALTALQQAQARAPARADLRKLQGDIARTVGDATGPGRPTAPRRSSTRGSSRCG